MEGLPDRAAAAAVRGRIDWPYLFALPLRDAGFDGSVPCELSGTAGCRWGGERPVRCRPGLKRSCDLVRARGRQRADATHVLAAVRSLNRLVCVTEAMCFVLEALACAPPDRLKAHAQPGGVERCERRSLSAERRGQTRSPRRRGSARTAIICGAPDAPDWLRRIPAVEILRRIRVQQIHLQDDVIPWRSFDDTPPAALFPNAPHDLDAHCARTDTISWIGYSPT